jgi:hypothetical protein
VSRHRYLRNSFAKSFQRGDNNHATIDIVIVKDSHCSEEVKRHERVSDQPAQTNGGCVGHGIAWLLASMLIIGLMFLVVFGCYWLSRLLR